MKDTLQKKGYIGWAISTIIPLFIYCIPITESFTYELKLFFSITLCIILMVAFELIPLLIAGVLLPTLYMMSGIVSMEIAFSSWTQPTVWIVLGGLIFSSALESCGLLKRIAFYTIHKCGGTYTGAVYGCFFIGILLNIITFCNGWLVASALVYGVCKAMQLKPSKESALICFAGTIGATGATIFLYYPAYYSMMEQSIQTFIPEYTMNFFTSFVYNGICGIFYLFILWLLIKLYGIKNEDFHFHKDLFQTKYKELGAWKIEEKRAIICIVLLLLYLFSTNFTKLPVMYGFMILSFIIFLPCFRVADTNILKQLNYPMVCFVSACLGIGLVGAHVGFSDFLSDFALSYLHGKPVLFVCFAFMIFGTLANFFMTPMAMLGGLSLPFVQIAISLDISPVVACMVLLYACEIVFLPYESAGNLLMYGYGMMPLKEFVKQEGLKAIIMMIGFVVIVYPLWNILGLL